MTLFLLHPTLRLSIQAPRDLIGLTRAVDTEVAWKTHVPIVVCPQESTTERVGGGEVGALVCIITSTLNKIQKQAKFIVSLTLVDQWKQKLPKGCPLRPGKMEVVY